MMMSLEFEKGFWVATVACHWEDCQTTLEHPVSEVVSSGDWMLEGLVVVRSVAVVFQWFLLVA